MNLNDFKIFEAVASLGNFTKAAEAMFTVQSNVTARIKNLEEEFGAPLFSRSSRKVELTQAGETLMIYSKKLNHLIEEAKQSIGKNDVVKGQIRIGALETMIALKGPELVNSLASQFPHVDLEFRSEMRDNLISEVLSYKLDAAFVPAPIDLSDLEQFEIKTEEIVAVAPSNCKSLDDLLAQKPLKVIVFDQGCVFRARLDSWLVSKGITKYHKTEMNSIEGVINFIESGIGFSFLPKEIISTFYGSRKVKTFALPKELGMMTTVLIYKKDIPLSPALRAFLSLFDRNVESI
ncbi:LysR family transcriptional regulator [Chryseobacterium sp. Ch-15]|uniref:LysR family transcriptional regulator n=1 Tax=Chryseobacterium muglaense TaxID=2893752 RepID=A0A9Q3YRP5_9FLAO|nr:LysR family transcriptional regulator [Chryseobacterium muglaense]MBD3906055.1 LysR family transcriptional regulator [Chryseobacterium muglaense]MCC9033007.1 LysR family transcriptional regulator [Chryseobacterium muglaense]MCM2556892.1 LysR family transcriptional regulator [Chryseobacterium muglaense]